MHARRILAPCRVLRSTPAVQFAGRWKSSVVFSLSSAAQRSCNARDASATFSTSARKDQSQPEPERPTYFSKAPASIAADAASIAATPLPSTPPRRRSRWWWVLGAGAMVWVGNKLYSSTMENAELRALEALSIEQLQNELAKINAFILSANAADDAATKALQPFLSQHLDSQASLTKFLPEVLDALQRDDRKKIHQFVDVFMTMKNQVDLRKRIIFATKRHTMIVAAIQRKQLAALNSK
jgi:hypothetical protein